MKLAIWCWVILGLLPCVFLASQVFGYKQLLTMRQFGFGKSEFVHHEYFRLQFGEQSLELFPRYWAFALLTAGIVAIIVSLIVLLHVPTRESSL